MSLGGGVVRKLDKRSAKTLRGLTHTIHTALSVTARLSVPCEKTEQCVLSKLVHGVRGITSAHTWYTSRLARVSTVSAAQTIPHSCSQALIPRAGKTAGRLPSYLSERQRRACAFSLSVLTPPRPAAAHHSTLPLRITPHCYCATRHVGAVHHHCHERVCIRVGYYTAARK